MGRIRRILRYLRGLIVHCIENDTIGIAAGVAFFFLIALFPLLMTAGWILERFQLSLRILEGFLPLEVIKLFDSEKLASPARTPITLLLTLWSASAGVWSLMKGVYKAYADKPLKSLRARFIAILFTVGFLAVLALTLGFLAAGRWGNLLMVGSAIFLLLLALYYYTPGTSAKLSRACWTAALAAGAWLLSCRGFEAYMRHFAAYNVLYGSLGAFLGLALWVFILSLIIVFGAELGGYEGE